LNNQGTKEQSFADLVAWLLNHKPAAVLFQRRRQGCVLEKPRRECLMFQG